MNESEQTKLFIEISSKLASIDTKMTTLCSTLAAHETRIANLESKHMGNITIQPKVDFKEQLLTLMAKAMVIGAVGVACLAGGAGILTKIFGA